MGVYASLLISLLLILQTVGISALSNASNSFIYGSDVSNSNHSINSHPVQQHHQLLVSPRSSGGREENRTAASWIVEKARGGRSGGVGGSNINHRPGKNKNSASNLFKSKITWLPTLLLTSCFYLF